MYESVDVKGEEGKNFIYFPLFGSCAAVDSLA